MSNDALLQPKKDSIPVEDEAIPVDEPEKKKKKKKKHSEGDLKFTMFPVVSQAKKYQAP